ncbi:MAG: CRISPR-associated endoribonuclease Cas6 [Bacteroidales bacterium]|nr:CRISPR-associated endoribonuclease Cas6 [Bacteroidales bacterium]
MRFKLQLQLQGDGLHSLPSNYQYELSSWISKTLHFGSEPLQKLLKEKSYLDQNQQFGHYTFSPLFARDFSHQDDRMLIGDSRIQMFLSMIPDDDIGSLVIDVFSKLEGRVGDKKSKLEFVIDEVEMLPEPVFAEEVTMSCITPMVFSDASNPKKIQYLSPEDKGFEKFFLKNLLAKYAWMMRYFPQKVNVALPELSELKFNLIGHPKGRVIKTRTETPNPVSIKGYLFDFSLKAPAALVRTGYDLGFGEQCSLGFGYCELK